jgi:hypothetical protein
VQYQNWQPSIEGPLYLHSATISEGPPGSFAQLRGEDRNLPGKPAITSYTFGALSVEQGKWLDCHYGKGAEVTLSRRLDDKVNECVITNLKRDPAERQAVTILCK